MIHTSPATDWTHYHEKFPETIPKPRVVGDGSEWKREVLEYIDRPEATGKVIVLIHGFGGSGRRSWGLLPGLFLRSGEASAVHLVTYKHDLYALRKRTINVLGDEFASMLKDIESESNRPIVVIGHSLGGLIGIRAFDRIRQLHIDGISWSEREFRQLSHLVCVASPITGTRFAYFALPFAWRCLRPMASYCTHTLDSLQRTFPLGYHEHRRKSFVPDCTILYGMRDQVVNPLIKYLGFPMVNSVPGWHGTYSGEVYTEDSPQFRQYQEILGPSRRMIGGLARVVWGAGNQQQKNRGLVVTVPQGGFDHSCVEEVVGSWDPQVSKGQRTVEVLMDLLTREGVASDSKLDQLRTRYEHALRVNEMLRMDWGRETTLLGWISGTYLALALLHEPASKRLRTLAVSV